ncbi:hypothetical protein NC651_022413 [Populus alba x Populus x berolinensis]|nr:hypothetical protein NC651_022413 [Populus alba x Populus x berolinensis]
MHLKSPFLILTTPKSIPYFVGMVHS